MGWTRDERATDRSRVRPGDVAPDDKKCAGSASRFVTTWFGIDGREPYVTSSPDRWRPPIRGRETSVASGPGHADRSQGLQGDGRTRIGRRALVTGSSGSAHPARVGEDRSEPTRRLRWTVRGARPRRRREDWENRERIRSVRRTNGAGRSRVGRGRPDPPRLPHGMMAGPLPGRRVERMPCLLSFIGVMCRVFVGAMYGFNWSGFVVSAVIIEAPVCELSKK